MQRIVLTLCLATGAVASSAQEIVEAETARRDDQPIKFHHGDWPFRPLARPAVPEVTNRVWMNNPIDAFILAELEKSRIEPNREAAKTELIRRLTFDLLGLPPTLDEIAAFEADDSPDAYERLVERLLASPRFGERWARHWLDVVRYADTAGFKSDFVRPEAYRYRDYVIRSLNEDLPYDQFVRQQLAGDELEPENPAALIATGMIRLYPEEATASDFVKLRQDVLDDVTETTGFAFSALTLGCAKCHDHKFDPVTQADFFRWEACFSSIVPRDEIPAMIPQDRNRYESQLDVWENATAEIRRQMDELIEPVRREAMREVTLAYDAETQAAWNAPAETRSTRQQQLLALSSRQVNKVMASRVRRMKGDAKAKYDELARHLATFEHLKPQSPPMAMSVMNGAGPAPAVYILAAGDYRKPLNEVSPGVPEFLGDGGIDGHSFASRSSAEGRRAALARWLTDPEHPLTARVVVNRVWHHYFHRGIVATPNDFGAMGAAPTHPKLIDWLAAELTERNWSLKEVHRKIVTSAVYRQSSAVDPSSERVRHALEVDSDNTRLWHAPRKRLDAEVIRDSLLALSGNMNERMYGPAGRPELPEVVVETSAYAWEADPIPANRVLRSIYSLQKRNMRLPLLASFDQPDMYNSCASRTHTVTPTQALSLWNGDLAAEQARRWSGKLLAETHGDSEFVVRAYREIYGRTPASEEIAAALGFLAAQTQRLTGDRDLSDDSLPLPKPSCLVPERAAAYVDFCHALLNSSEFLYLD